MDPLSATASIIAILQLSNRVVGYLNDVKDASKDRAKCATEAANLYSLLTSLRFRLEEGRPNMPWYTAVRALAFENGPLDQFRQALEQLQSKMTGGGKTRKAGDALIWKFKKEEITSILGKMERLKTLVQVALQMDHFKLSQAIKDDSDFIRTYISTINSGLDTIRQDQDHARHGKLMEWISPTNFSAQQSDLIGRRQEGTGQWFLDATEFVGWLRKPKETLFCPGIPGAGKTMIAAIAIDHLLKTVQSSSVGVAYVYCNYKAQEEQDATSLLAAILKQLLTAQSSLVEPVERLYQQHPNLRTKPLRNEILGALRSVLTNYSTVHVVIDALDECRDSDGTRCQFLAKLRDLQAETDLRLMVTSRFIPEIVLEFREALRLEVRASNEDVRRFVAGQTYRLPKCIQRDSALQDMVQEMITKAVDGMFLLAQLHTDSLLDKRTAKDVKSTLATFSRGSTALDDAYEQAIQRIEGQLSGDYQRAKEVLSWITYAQRPLTTAEICCALAVELGEEELNPENVPDIEDLVSVCAGLVVVDEGSGIIRFVHYTTQDYFERIREEWSPSAQLDIASTCLTYLSFSTFKSGSCSTDEEFEERLRQNKFLDYAAKHWGQHILTVQDEACELACSFLLHSGSISCATQALLVANYGHKYYSQCYPRRTTGMHLAARSGLSVLAQKLLYRLETEGVNAVHARESGGKTPLLLAAKHGHGGILELLVDRGADVNTQGGLDGKALYAASLGGHEQVVKLLIDNGADVNAQNVNEDDVMDEDEDEEDEDYMAISYLHALQAASTRGHEQIVKLLLDKGADVNVQGGSCGNALYAASEGGYEQIVKLLVSNGADVNAQGGYYGNALYAASEGGYEQVVKLLVGNGADVNAQSGYYGNALQAALAEGHERIVRLLLDKGAGLNAQCGGHALEVALAEGHEQIVRLLLDKGLDINVKGGEDGNILHTVSSGGHEQIVKLLLDKGADINAQGSVYSNALHGASEGGYEQIVRLLLDKGADVSTQGRRYGNALYRTSAGDYEQVGRYGNALYAASAGGYEQIVKLLLDKGADVNAQGGYYGNALHAASFKGHKQIVRLLLNKGADVNARSIYYGIEDYNNEDYEGNIYDEDGDSSNPLQAASFRGHEQIVRLLLEKGADANAHGGFYGNALQAASAGGHEQVVKLLVDKGATRPIWDIMPLTC